MYQFPLTGNSFQLDNQAVYRKLKAFLIDSPGWAWIELHDTAENGRAAYMVWMAHFFVTPVERFRDASYYEIFTNYTNSYVASYDYKPTP